MNSTREILEKVTRTPLPEILYHATFGIYAKSILNKGLTLSGNVPNFSGIEPGIYLDDDIESAIAYAEATENENLTDEQFDDIVVFSVATKDLDVSKLSDDPNVKWSDSDEHSWSYIYHSDISTNFLTLENV